MSYYVMSLQIKLISGIIFYFVVGKVTVSALSGCSTDTEKGCSPNLDELLKEVLSFTHLLKG